MAGEAAWEIKRVIPTVPGLERHGKRPQRSGGEMGKGVRGTPLGGVDRSDGMERVLSHHQARAIILPL
jgi:hypothetical protein